MGKTFRLGYVRDGHGDTNAHVRASARQRRLDAKRARQAGNVEAVTAAKAIEIEAAQDDEDKHRDERESRIAENLAEEASLVDDGWPDPRDLTYTESGLPAW